MIMKKLLNSNQNLTFNGIHKSYENYDSYTFKQNEIMDKPNGQAFVSWF